KKQINSSSSLFKISSISSVFFLQQNSQNFSLYILIPFQIQESLLYKISSLSLQKNTIFLPKSLYFSFYSSAFLKKLNQIKYKSFGSSQILLYPLFGVLQLKTQATNPLFLDVIKFILAKFFFKFRISSRILSKAILVSYKFYTKSSFKILFQIKNANLDTFIECQKEIQSKVSKEVTKSQNRSFFYQTRFILGTKVFEQANSY
ncbi:hypothetical protein IMG5_101450, partial [Ichthyophthirius multifiliis]